MSRAKALVRGRLLIENRRASLSDVSQGLVRSYIFLLRPTDLGWKKPISGQSGAPSSMEGDKTPSFEGTLVFYGASLVRFGAMRLGNAGSENRGRVRLMREILIQWSGFVRQKSRRYTALICTSWKCGFIC